VKVIRHPIIPGELIPDLIGLDGEFAQAARCTCCGPCPNWPRDSAGQTPVGNVLPCKRKERLFGFG